MPPKIGHDVSVLAPTTSCTYSCLQDLEIPEHPPANTAHHPSIQCDCSPHFLVSFQFSFQCLTLETNEIPEYIPIFAVDQANNEYANVTLLRHRLLGCSPVAPSIAIDVQTLELYHHLRRRHPQLGVQPFVKTLCDLHEVILCMYLFRNTTITLHHR